MAEPKLADALVQCHRDLFTLEARLAETIAPAGGRVLHSIVDQWLVLEEYLRIYAAGLSPAGLLVLGGRPDAGSSRTGIPFTGPAEARAHLGLSTDARGASPGGASFWRAVLEAQAESGGAPLEGLFGTAFLGHAIPFDVTEGHEDALFRASAPHVARLLDVARPQLVAAVGADALALLGHASRQEGLSDLARVDEGRWLDRWGAGRPISSLPLAETSAARFRVIPCPRLDGDYGASAVETLKRAFLYAW